MGLARDAVVETSMASALRLRETRLVDRCCESALPDCADSAMACTDGAEASIGMLCEAAATVAAFGAAELLARLSPAAVAGVDGAACRS